jgi:hypothetical protein
MKTKTLLYGLIGLLVLAATATGVFYQTQGAHIEYVTVRGEPGTLQGSGLYQYDPAAEAREVVFRVWHFATSAAGEPNRWVA